MEDIAKLITTRQALLEKQREPMIEVWNDVSQFVNIGLGDMSGQIRNVSQMMRGIGKKAFNGTAIGAAMLATDGIHGYHVSPSFPWFSYAMSRAVLNKVHDIKMWLQDEEQELYLALNDSNFYAEMWPFIFNGFTVGTSTIYCEYDFDEDKVAFECLHPIEVYIAENRYGQVDLLHRKWRVPLRQIVQKFGEEKLPEELKQPYKNNMFEEHEIIHAVYPRAEYDPRKKDKKNKKYASVWLLTGSNKILGEGGYDYFPYKVWRYTRMGNYPYGLSPAILFMCDIKGLNVVTKTLLGAAEMMVNPPLNIPVGLVGKVEWRPRGELPYTKENMFTRPAIVQNNYPVGSDREEKMEAALKSRFHVDTFLMLSQLAGKGQRTKYEVSEMMGEKAAVLGAELAPLNTQMDGILDLVYTLKANLYPANNGSITPRPDILYELAVEGDSFSPMYMGPLAQAQRTLYKTQGLRGAFESLLPVMNIFPEDVKRVINGEETVRAYLDSFSYPERAINSYAKTEELKAADDAAMAEAMQQQQLMQMGGGIKTLSEADKNMEGKLSGLAQGALEGALGE